MLTLFFFFIVHTQLFINNEFVPGRGPLIDTINPVNEQVICKVHSASEEDVDAAVDAANAAFKNEWKKVAAAQRGRYLNKLADLMERDIDELATLEALDNGKSFVVARDVDITDSIACFRYFAGWADKIHGNTIETTYDKMCYTRMEPVGCVASVTPWNYSIMMPVSLNSERQTLGELTSLFLGFFRLGNWPLLWPPVTPVSTLLLMHSVFSLYLPPIYSCS